MEKIRMYLVDTEECVGEVVEIEDDYRALQRAIYCDCIGITSRVIGGKRFDVVYDDEGLYKYDIKWSATWSDKMAEKLGKYAFAGSILIAGVADIEGNLTGLTDEDIEIIEANLGVMVSSDGINLCIKDMEV